MGRRAWATAGVVAICASVAAVVTGAGSARPEVSAVPARTLQCPYTRNPQPGWQATFGRFDRESAANELQARAMRSGFHGLTVQPNCAGGYEVALRGICPFARAYDFQQQARRASFNVVLEYKKPQDVSPDLVAVFGHFRTRAGAEAFRPRVERQFQHVTIIQDGGCGNDWEVAVTGIASPAQGAEFAAQARRLGLPVSIELN
jgi:cell division septation protein DedD